MPDNRKRARIVQALTRLRMHSREVIGGNQALIDSETIPGYVVVADINDQDEPTLDIYTWDYMERWYDEAKAFQVQDDTGLSLAESMFEIDCDPDFANDANKQGVADYA